MLDHVRIHDPNVILVRFKSDRFPYASSLCNSVFQRRFLGNSVLIAIDVQRERLRCDYNRIATDKRQHAAEKVTPYTTEPAPCRRHSHPCSYDDVVPKTFEALL